MKRPTPAEVEQLLAVAEAPELKLDVRPRGPAELMQAFLEDNSIRPGRAVGVEACTLYKFYRRWHAALPDPPTLLTPRQFAMRLHFSGFRKIRKLNRVEDGRERRVLGLDRGSARRFSDWRRANIETFEDRVIFYPKGLTALNGAKSPTKEDQDVREAATDGEAGEAADDLPRHDRPGAGDE